MFPYAS